MKKILLLTILLFASSAFAVCTTEYEPVCTESGTFFNECTALEADANVLYEGECQFEETTTGFFDLPDFEWLGQLGDIGTVLQDFATNIAGNLSAVEIGLIFSMVFLLMMLLRAKVLVHLFLWVAAGVVAFVIAAILFGVINL